MSDSPLALPNYSHDALCHVECLRAPASTFLQAIERVRFDPRSDGWHRYGLLDDGSTYVRWDTVGEFLVSPDGRRIVYRRIEGASAESFQVYLLGQALSCALVNQRIEPLHATVVVVNDRAVAFLGGNAFGKSTLAACFLEAGCRLLTDDLLVLQESTTGGIVAYPGPPRLKLFPKMASRFLGTTAGVDMNPDTDKLILPIDEHQSCRSPVPLSAIYSLAVPRDACRQPHARIETLSPREAFMELVKAAFNRRLVGRERSAHQFRSAERLADLVLVKRLVYPRAIDRLEEVREILLDDLQVPSGDLVEPRT